MINRCLCYIVSKPPKNVGIRLYLWSTNRQIHHVNIQRYTTVNHYRATLLKFILSWLQQMKSLSHNLIVDT